MNQRSPLLLVAAMLLVVVVVGLVLAFGIARPPELERLADNPSPAPSGSVAWTAFDSGSGGECLSVAHPDGQSDELTCSRRGGNLIGWTGEGILMWSYGPRDTLRTIDPATGEQLDSQPIDPDDSPSFPEAVAVIGHHQDGVLTVTRDDNLEVIWAIEAPENYRVDTGTLSPDGEWVAMFDSTERLLVVPADGSAPPRIWVEDAGSWQMPLWEGTEPATGS